MRELRNNEIASACRNRFSIERAGLPRAIPSGISTNISSIFMDITPDSARFEQTFSDDEGKTWETNWVMTFKRLKAADKPR
jgi:hypothetical protein